MRERLLQLLPEICVTGVTGVPEGEKSREHCISGRGVCGTPSLEHGVPSVPAPGEAVHLLHPKPNEVYQEKPNKISDGTPVTPGTPVFAQDFIEAYQERAAIMEFDAGLSRHAAEAAAYEDCKQTWMNRKEML